MLSHVPNEDALWASIGTSTSRSRPQKGKAPANSPGERHLLRVVPRGDLAALQHGHRVSDEHYVGQRQLVVGGDNANDGLVLVVVDVHILASSSDLHTKAKASS